MAYLKPIKDRKGLKRWYSHIRSVNWVKEEYISLKTTSKITARVRHAMVEKVESDIKKGMKFKFPWQSDDGGKTKVILLTIGKCLIQWLNIKATNTSPETHRTYLSSLKNFIITLKHGEASPMRNIKTKDVEYYKSIDYIFGMITGASFMVAFWACTSDVVGAGSGFGLYCSRGENCEWQL